MTILFLAALLLCGWFDLKDRQVPLWGILLVGIGGIGMCVSHPVFSILSGTIIIIVCLLYKMGPADRFLFPVAAAAFGLFGVLIVSITLALAILHTRRRPDPAPGVTYLAVASTAAMLIGGFI